MTSADLQDKAAPRFARWKIGLVAGVIIVLIAAWFINRPPAAKTEQQWQEEALQIGKKQDWNGLLGLAQQWATAQPNSLLAWVTLGDAYRQTNQHQHAIEIYSKIVSEKPDMYQVHSYLGVELFNVGKLDEAKSACQQSLKLNPKYADARFCLATVAGFEGNPKDLLEHYQQLQKLNSALAQQFDVLAKQVICPKNRDKLGKEVCKG